MEVRTDGRGVETVGGGVATEEDEAALEWYQLWISANGREGIKKEVEAVLQDRQVTHPDFVFEFEPEDGF